MRVVFPTKYRQTINITFPDTIMAKQKHTVIIWESISMIVLVMHHTFIVFLSIYQTVKFACLMLDIICLVISSLSQMFRNTCYISYVSHHQSISLSRESLSVRSGCLNSV